MAPTHNIIFFALQSMKVPQRGSKSMHEFIVLLRLKYIVAYF